MLAPGTRLGVYEVVGAIGAGGMGEVYRARDLRLKRDVALKILPESFASDPERLVRFQREAEVLASLNHPNIAQIYGIEESNGTRALVMELVEGEDLSQRIARGPIPIDETLPIAKQIAEALEAAHEQGIVHRDLKPANIKLRSDGTVKVLDFGLAKLADSGAVSNSNPTALSMSPTITSPALVSGVGVLLGTAAYMSPEQAKGRPADKRSDVWAFGAVLFEMLTGKRAFEGDEVSDTLASVLAREPDWTAVPATVPPAVRTLLHRSVEKDRRKRIGDLAAALFVIDQAMPATNGVAIPLLAADQPRWRRMGPVLVALIAGAVLSGIGAWTILDEPRQSILPVQRFSVFAPEPQRIPTGVGTAVGLDPEGKVLLYEARGGDGIVRLYRRALDQFDAMPIGDPGAQDPSFSPDGLWIQYHVGQTLKRVPATGGASQTLAQLPAGLRGLTWESDNTIIVGLFSTSTGLMRIPAGGGMPTPLTTPKGGRMHWYPQVLPEHRVVLYTSSQPIPDTGDLELLDLDTGTVRTLFAGSAGHVLPTGHLVFVKGNTLWAVRFDLQRLEVVGVPAPVVEGVRVEQAGAVQMAISDSGTLAYLAGAGTTSRRLTWVDRQGGEEVIPAAPHAYAKPRLSPDGKQLAVVIADRDRDIWIWDFARRTPTRVTFDSPMVDSPVWTADGNRIVFASGSDDQHLNPYIQAANGTGKAERLISDPRPMSQFAMSPDGTRLVMTVVNEATGQDIAMLPIDADRHLTTLVATRFNERNPALSFDGRWLAYDSNESGQFEVYVRPFPGVDAGRWQVSTNGGSRPMWTRNGRELLYYLAGGFWSASLHTDRAFVFSAPIHVVETGNLLVDAGNFQGRDFDIDHKTGRLLVLKSGTQDPNSVSIVVNWFEELKRIVPTK